MSGTGGGGNEDYLAIAYRDATGGLRSACEHGDELEKRLEAAFSAWNDRFSRFVDRHEAELQQAAVAQVELANRLDAALKRIEQLERKPAQPNAVDHPCSPTCEICFPDVRRCDMCGQEWHKGRCEARAYTLKEARPAAPIDQEDV